MRPVLLLALLFSAAAMSDESEALLARIVDDNTARVPLHTVAPLYPKKARRDRVEGEVQVCFDITRDGRPRRIGVRRSTNRAFERPSIRAVKASSFRPLRDDQILQSIKTCRTFIFSLQAIRDETP